MCEPLRTRVVAVIATEPADACAPPPAPIALPLAAAAATGRAQTNRDPVSRRAHRPRGRASPPPPPAVVHKRKPRESLGAARTPTAGVRCLYRIAHRPQTSPISQAILMIAQRARFWWRSGVLNKKPLYKAFSRVGIFLPTYPIRNKPLVGKPCPARTNTYKLHNLFSCTTTINHLTPMLTDRSPPCNPCFSLYSTRVFRFRGGIRVSAHCF